MKTQFRTYRLRNWRDYNASLVRRGSLTLWLEDDVASVASWWRASEPTDEPRKRGASNDYSDRAIEACLSLRVLLGLALRQTEGFVRSLLNLTGLSLPVPDYTTLCRRQKDLTIVLPVRSSAKPRHIVIDSTGLKVFGEGEWKVRKHGKNRRRVWKKVHLAVDEATGEVLAVVMTGGDAADGPLLPELVPECQRVGGPVAQVSADGAYDSWSNDTFLTEQNIVATIPPRKGSKIRQHGNARQAPPLQRDTNLRQIRKRGRARWATASGYSRRSLSETQMMRQKKILGSSLASRSEQNQTVECRLRCAILNRLTHLGMPDAYLNCV